MAIRSRGYYREQRQKHIERKKRIIKELGDYWRIPHDGMLSKGKIHCSCPMCRGKDIRGRHIKTLQEQRIDDDIPDQLYWHDWMKYDVADEAESIVSSSDDCRDDTISLDELIESLSD